MISLGLYDIGVRGLTVPQSLELCARWSVPYLHIRLGPRGHDPHHCGPHVPAWKDAIRKSGVPITLLCTAVELESLMRSHPEAGSQLAATYAVAEGIGEPRPDVRLLAINPPSAGLRPIPAGQIVELHHRSWFTHEGCDALTSLLATRRRGGLLLDTLQAVTAEADEDVLSRLAPRVDVIHLSDHGQGFDERHELVLRTISRAGRTPPLAFEWTGDERTEAVCHERYTQALDWLRGTDLFRGHARQT